MRAARTMFSGNVRTEDAWRSGAIGHEHHQHRGHRPMLTSDGVHPQLMPGYCGASFKDFAWVFPSGHAQFSRRGLAA
jgi:hypothetical protein